jgi:hypothetical protein
LTVSARRTGGKDDTRIFGARGNKGNESKNKILENSFCDSHHSFFSEQHYVDLHIFIYLIAGRKEMMICHIICQTKKHQAKMSSLQEI